MFRKNVCNKIPKNKNDRFAEISKLFLITGILVLFFALGIFIAERLTDFSLNITIIESLSIADNVIFLIIIVIFSIFVGLILVDFMILRIKQKRC